MTKPIERIPSNDKTIMPLRGEGNQRQKNRTPQEQRIASLESIIRSYEMDIINAEHLFGVDLVKMGFCQGTIYKEALNND